MKKSNALIHRCVIDSNRTTWYSGGGIRAIMSADTIENCIIINNYTANCCGNVGGGVLITGNSSTVVQNNIFAWNQSPNNGKSIHATDSTVTIWYNDFFGSPLTEYVIGGLDSANLFVDPMFTNAMDGDFFLSPASPCIDAGHPDPAFNDPDGSRNDMGILGGRDFQTQIHVKLYNWRYSIST